MVSAGPRSRVLRLITRLNVGGPARQALLLTRRLADEFPTTLAAGSPGPNEGELGDPTVPVRHLPLVRAIRPDADVRAARAVRRLLVENRTWLLHTHMAKAGTVGRMAALTLPDRPKTVHTFHGHVLEGYFSRPVQRAFVEIERALARRTDVLVAVSPQVRDALLDLGIGRASQYEVIPLGLDLASHLAVDGPSGHLRRHLGLSPEVPLVGFLGRLVPIKDVDTLLAATAALPGVHLAVVGDGECRPELERRVADLDLGNRVHFTGWWADMAAALSDLDVVALTSLNEGTPVALIEAGAAGRPVVATRVGGVADVVLDGVTGHLVPPRDSERVATGIRSLLGDPGERARMGLAGREHVRLRFGEDRLVGAIRSLYADLAATPHRARRGGARR